MQNHNVVMLKCYCCDIDLTVWEASEDSPFDEMCEGCYNDSLDPFEDRL